MVGIENIIPLGPVWAPSASGISDTIAEIKTAVKGTFQSITR